jgi:hypothetical protein
MMTSAKSDTLLALGDRIEARPEPHKAQLDFLEANLPNVGSAVQRN